MLSHLRHPASDRGVADRMLIAIMAVSVAGLLAVCLVVRLTFTSQRHLATLLNLPTEPSAVTKLVREQQRYLQAFGDVTNQTFSQVQEHGKILTELDSEVRRQLSGPPSKVSDKKAGTRKELSQDRLMAELAHSLATPLSGLKARILALCDEYGDGEPNLLSEFAALQTRIEVCEAVLATFRRVNRAAAVDSSYQLASIADTLRLVHHDADRRVGVSTRLEMDLPEVVAGFDNSYLATLLLPLVENAVEASPHNGLIELEFSDHETYVQFEVGNDVREPVVMDMVFAPGGSTKDGHEGLGVPTVRWLAESVRGGSLIANVSGDRFRALVRLPRRTR